VIGSADQGVQKYSGHQISFIFWPFNVNSATEGFVMNRLIFLLYTLLEQRFRPQYDARLRFLELQIRILRSRIGTNRIVPSPEEKLDLLRLGVIRDHDVRDVIHIVQLETYKTWIRKQRHDAGFRRSGRPRIPETLRRLITRIGHENIRWGYRRVMGELKKLGYHVSATTIRSVLRESGLPPPPYRGVNPLPVAWKTFIHANLESVVATDFFTKKIHTLRGTFTAYCLVFIHLGSRRVWCSPATYHPNGEWVVQQNRNAAMWLKDEGIEAKFLLSDRDAKYPDAVKHFWKSEHVRCLKSPPRAPKANAFVESFIGTLKRECLSHFVCFSRDQLDYINQTWIGHYNTERPHRGIGMENEVLDQSFVPKHTGKIRSKRKLGGIVTSYYREAA
jgi:putative transposase